MKTLIPDISLPPVSKWLRWLFLMTVAGVGLTFSQGLNYLSDNHLQYYLHGMRLYDPSYIPNDWFAAKTLPHHLVFDYLLAFLQFFGPLKTVTLIAQAVTFVISATGLWVITRRFSNLPNVVFPGIIVWLALTQGNQQGLGGLCLLSGHFQASQVAGAGILLGYGLLFEKHYLGAGFIFGIAGLFHTGFLVGFAPLVVCQYFYQEREILRALGRFHLPSRKALFESFRFFLPLLLFWVPVLWRAAGWQEPSGPVSAREIMIQIRSPHHFRPELWSVTGSLGWGLWVLLAALAIGSKSKQVQWKPLAFAFWTTLAYSAATVAAAALKISSFLTVLCPWRAALLIPVLGMVALLDCVWKACLEDPPRFRVVGYSILAALFWVAWSFLPLWPLSSVFSSLLNASMLFFPLWILLLFLVREKPNRWGAIGWIVVCLPGAVVLLQGRDPGPYRWLKWGVSAVPFLIFSLRRFALKRPYLDWTAYLLLFCLLLGSSVYGYKHLSLDGTVAPDRETQELDHWVQNETDPNSIFMLPVSEGACFRVRNTRAIVVDAKCTPFHPDGILEWYRRMKEFCEEDSSSGLFPLRERANIPAPRISELAREYGAPYYVLDLFLKDARPYEEFPCVFSNTRYLVYQVLP